MNDTLTFHLLKNSSHNDYLTYYAIPEAESGNIKTGDVTTAFIVMHNNKVVFIPDNYRSQFEGVNKCKEYIESVTKGK